MPRQSSAKSGQAMIETVLAVLVIAFLFFVLFRLSYMLTSKILLEHAAMRVARARTVGLNDFMCEKAGRVAVIPVAGQRLWPAEEDEFDFAMELARIPIYMGTPNAAVANGVLEYEGWKTMHIDPGTGRKSRVSMSFSPLGDEDGEWMGRLNLEGKASIEENYQLYMDDQGR